MPSTVPAPITKPPSTFVRVACRPLPLASAAVLGWLLSCSAMAAPENASEARAAPAAATVEAKPSAGSKPPAAVAQRPLSATPEPEEYALWSQVLAHGLDQSAKGVVLAHKTHADLRGVVPPGAKLEEIARRLETTPALLSRWVALNQEAAALERNFKLPLPYVFADARELAELFKGPDPATGWQRFAAAHPGAPGLLRVSRAALDDSGQNALVYVEFQCGAQCGSGRLIRAQLDAKGWRLLSGELIWMTGP